MKGFTIKGPQGAIVSDLIGISVIEDGIINLKYAILKGCTHNSVAIGFEGNLDMQLSQRHLSQTIENMGSSLLVLIQH